MFSEKALERQDHGPRMMGQRAGAVPGAEPRQPLRWTGTAVSRHGRTAPLLLGQCDISCDVVICRTVCVRQKKNGLAFT